MKKLIRNKRNRLLFNIIVVMIVYNALIITLVHVEKISDQSNLTNYSNAYWYSIVTLTTVGYGDMYPGTLYGRIIGYIFVLCSMAFYGLLIGNISSIIANYRESKKLGYNGTNFKGHTVIIGWNEFGEKVAEQLLLVNRSVAIVTNERSDIDFIHEKYKSSQLFVLYSEFKNFEMLKKINIEESSSVFINLQDDTEKLVYILNMRKSFPQLEYVVILDNGDLKNTFHSAGVHNCISKHEVASKLLASYMFEPDVAAYTESILSIAKDDSDYDIKQILVTEENPYLGKTYQETFIDVKMKYNSVLIGITKRDKSGMRKLIKNPLGELHIAEGDYLIMILNGKSFKIISKAFKMQEGFQSVPKA